MTLTGRQKAALLLMSLDVATATEILKGFDPQVVQELAVELSYLDAAGYRNSQAGTVVTQEFYELLRKGPQFEFKSFLDEMLKNTLGQEKALQIQSDIQGLLKKKDPFLAARSAGVKTHRIILRHILPHAISPIMVAFTMGIAGAIMIESTLSFLGIGVQPPTPSWGNIINAGKDNIDIAWWLVVFPGIAIMTAFLAFLFFGEGIREASDPRLKA